MPLRFDFDGYSVGSAKVELKEDDDGAAAMSTPVGKVGGSRPLFETCNTVAYITHALLAAACIGYLYIAQAGDSVLIPFTSTVTSWETNVSLSTTPESIGECTVAPSIIFPTDE